ncbi:MAG: FAD-dependent oxidoreductase, partial [Saprospiraceae bacterium]
QGNLRAVQVVDVHWSTDPITGKSGLKEVEGSIREIPCQLAFIAVGFLYPQPDGMLQELGLPLDPRGNIQTDEKYRTGVEKVFAAGDMRRGQSLVVWAISEGREAARAVDEYLMGESALESKAQSALLTPG